ncbi:MAG: YwqG family protein [Candidatus Obscuribacterales bacterium]
MTSTKIEEILESHDLAEFKGLFEESKPSLRLTFSEDKAEESVSRAGGRPLLPFGYEWPRSRSKIPLAFLCQIDLSDSNFKPYEQLPKRGLLSFFYDAFDGPWGNQSDDHFGWRVQYFEDLAVLKHTDFPADLPTSSVFAPCAVSFKDELSYNAITVEMAAVSDGGYSSYEAYLDAAEEIYGSPVVHRMLGYAQDIAGDFRLDCEIASRDLNLDDDFDFCSTEGEKLALQSEKWLLLLQLDSDPLAQMMWVDNGRLYFAIREEDLIARRFEKVWLICETQ